MSVLPYDGTPSRRRFVISSWKFFSAIKTEILPCLNVSDAMSAIDVITPNITVITSAKTVKVNHGIKHFKVLTEIVYLVLAFLHLLPLNRNFAATIEIISLPSSYIKRSTSILSISLSGPREFICRYRFLTSCVTIITFLFPFLYPPPLKKRKREF